MITQILRKPLFQYKAFKNSALGIKMPKQNTEKRWERELRKILSILRDIDMKVNHIIERLKSTYTYLDLINSSINSK